MGKVRFVSIALAVVLTASVLFFWLAGFGNGRAGTLPVGKGRPAVSLGERHGLILASDGSLWAWGSDFLGWPVLGLGSNRFKSTRLAQIGHDTNWVSISAGTDHSVATKSDGTIWTWGEPVPRSRTAPTMFCSPVLAAPGNDWKQGVAGGNISAAIKSNGTLWAWGDSWAGSVGDGTTNRKILSPVQIGPSTNWVKVWAGVLETVGLQADGSLWYWGENPDPSFGQGAGQIVSPQRVGSDTNWVDVGFGVNTVFAIKSDGGLWTWGRNADRFTGAKNTASNAIPCRIGTNSDWQSICATTGWWCLGLVKKDRSVWYLDGSDRQPNGPRAPYKPFEIRRVPFKGPYAACAAGSMHAAPTGVHGLIGVAVQSDGEVWTWGMVLGDPLTIDGDWERSVASIKAHLFRSSDPSWGPPPVYVFEPWRLKVD